MTVQADLDAVVGLVQRAMDGTATPADTRLLAREFASAIDTYLQLREAAERVLSALRSPKAAHPGECPWCSWALDEHAASCPIDALAQLLPT